MRWRKNRAETNAGCVSVFYQKSKQRTKKMEKKKFQSLPIEKLIDLKKKSSYTHKELYI